MSLPISCSQFDTRVQQLMDQRRDLSKDSILKAHAVECFECFQTLTSFQDLDDSFSGKIPIELTQALEKQLDENRGFNPMWPILFAVVAILAVSSVTFLSGRTRNASMVTVSDSESEPIQSRDNKSPSTDDKPTGVGVAKRLERPSANESISSPPSSSLSYSQLQASFPRLSTYYRYSSELPGIRPLQESINAAILWVQNAFLQEQSENDGESLDVGAHLYGLTAIPSA